MKIHQLNDQLWLPKPVGEIFDFFADARNLQLLTPPFLGFRILTPMPVEMKPGTIIDYKLRVHGLPIFWRTEISEWEPGRRFVDQQLRGPYRLWHHEHTFEPRDGGTLVSDKVRYAVLLDPIIHPLFVKPDVQRIFSFRREKMLELFTGDS
ncbi:MAG: SRPBCC family protein [Verrucomicrobiales bacterium]|nr:SRPBCC family protein [Verrucomicrobiota bacterium JB025]